MPITSCSVYVRERSELHERAVVRASGEPWGSLDVGEDREVSLYGSPAAMRRLGAAVMAAADAADELDHAEGAAPAAA